MVDDLEQYAKPKPALATIQKQFPNTGDQTPNRKTQTAEQSPIRNPNYSQAYTGNLKPYAKETTETKAKNIDLAPRNAVTKSNGKKDFIHLFKYKLTCDEFCESWILSG